MKKKFIKVPIEISARHIHLTPKNFETLFKKNQPTFLRKLGQQQFSTKETVEIINKNKSIKKVRLVVPFRDKTQVEISMTDAVNLGIKPAIRNSGSLKNTPAIEIKGPKGKLRIKEGVIVTQRHLHLNLNEAKKLGLKNKDIVWVLVKGKRVVFLGNVIVRVGPRNNICVHLDSDEGNAAGIFKKGTGYLLKITND
jgi:putative phosphotransacetylase